MGRITMLPATELAIHRHYQEGHIGAWLDCPEPECNEPRAAPTPILNAAARAALQAALERHGACPCGSGLPQQLDGRCPACFGKDGL